MRTLAIVFSFSLIGCVSGTPGGDDSDGDLVVDGGRIALPGCGYELITGVGAEAPAPGAEASGTDPAPFQVHLGFGGDPTTSMAVQWRTDEATTTTRVEYGVGTALDQTLDGMTFRYVAGVGGIGDIVRMHETHLCGLTPDTEYSYRVGDGTTWSPTYTFRTAPDVTASPDTEVLIAMIGDSRGGYDVWATLLEDFAARGIDLIMFSGDAVTVGQVQPEWDDFFSAAPDVLARLPMVSAQGNHDLNSVNYYSQFAMPGDESDYAFSYGHARMIVLNDTPVDQGRITGESRAFLDAELTASTARWTILNHHRPIWSSGTRHGSDSSLRDAWGPVIDEHHVDLVVAGHDHIYERSKPMLADQVQAAPADGTVYVVAGGAGANLYSTLPDFFTELADARHSAAIVSVRRDSLTLEAFEPGGTVPFDQLAITKP